MRRRDGMARPQIAASQRKWLCFGDIRSRRRTQVVRQARLDWACFHASRMGVQPVAAGEARRRRDPPAVPANALITQYGRRRNCATCSLRDDATGDGWDGNAVMDMRSDGQRGRRAQDGRAATCSDT
jgi:hypothetical protein